MPEQALYSLLGILGTAVTGLAYQARKGSKNGHLPDASLQRLTNVMEKQTEVLQKMAEATAMHNAESKGRHDVLLTILAELQRR